MTSPLHAKISSIERGYGTRKPFWEICLPFGLFFFYIVVTRFMIGHCPPGQPNKKNAYRGFIGKRQMQTWHVPGAVLKISSDRDLKFEFWNLRFRDSVKFYFANKVKNMPQHMHVLAPIKIAGTLMIDCCFHSWILCIYLVFKTKYLYKSYDCQNVRNVKYVYINKTKFNNRNSLPETFPTCSDLVGSESPALVSQRLALQMEWFIHLVSFKVQFLRALKMFI